MRSIPTVRLHEMQAVNAGETHDLACAIIMFDACRAVVHRQSRNAAAQRLDDQIVGFRSELCRATACSQSRIGHFTAIGDFFGLIGLVIYARFSIGSRSCPLSALRCFPPDPLVGPFFIAIVAYCPSTREMRWHQGFVVAARFRNRDQRLRCDAVSAYAPPTVMCRPRRCDFSSVIIFRCKGACDPLGSQAPSRLRVKDSRLTC